MAYIDLDMLGIGKCNEQLFEDTSYAKGWNAVIDIIENTSTADVVEVKHGEWKQDFDEKYYCSRCGRYPKQDVRDYCPYCGAKMDGRRTE